MGEQQAFTVTEPPQPDYVRSPVTFIRLAVSWLLFVGLGVAVHAADQPRFAAGLSELLASVPHWLVSGVVALCQITFLIPAVLALVGQLFLRRWMRVARMVLAALISAAALAALIHVVGTSTMRMLPPPDGAGGLTITDFGIGAAFPTTLDLAVIASWMYVDRALWSTRWRWIGRAVMLVGMVAHFGVWLSDPTVILAAVAAGAVAAAVVQVLLGVPNTAPRAVIVGHLLRELGHVPTAVERFGGFRGFAGFRVWLADGRQLFVKIVSRDSWAELLPVRLYRAARFRDVDLAAPFRSLRSAVEHEALCSLKAHSDGVPTARLVEVAEFPPDAMLMAFESRPFLPIADLPDERRSPALLTKVWDIVGALQRSHTVHGRLNADSLFADDDDNVVLVAFDSAALGVMGPRLSTDVAEVLAATSAVLGPELAVAEAIGVVGPDVVAQALPRLQPLALTPTTRAAVKSAGVLEPLREEIQRLTGVEEAPIDPIERVKPRTLLGVVMAVVAIGTLVPQLLGLGSLWGELRTANWWWALAALGLSAITYVGAAMAMAGSVPEPLPIGPNVAVQFATSYVGVVAPGGALAVAASFLRKRGIDTGTAVAAVSVNTVAGVIVHLTLTGLFFALAGSSGLGTFELPSLTTIGLVGAGIALIMVIGAALPWSRSLLTTRVLPATRRSLASVAEIARHPSKMIGLFGGSLVITVGYILALAASVSAFGVGPAFTSIALVYLVGSVLSSAAPTPGGLGAVEATLIAGLTSAGLPGATAVAAVVLFRLATFWVPLVPGWVAFTA
ncbi:MAG: lysylphosphatidylglycerol synthase domain-containing protein, partial [Ilumatobacteraceae bacterium]